VEISARVIKTESYEIVAAGTQVVPKTWQDGPAPSAVAPEQPSESAAEAGPERSVSSPSRARRLNIKGFADFVLGVSNSKMDLEFKNSSRGINQSELGFGGITPNPFTSISFDGLTTKTSVPLGMRVGAYGQIIGGDMEISYFSHGMNSQSTSFSVNGISRGGFRFTADNYLKVTVLNLLTGDIFVRIPTSETVFPYVGLGMGMTLNTVTSSYAKANSGGFVNSSLSETTPGFTFRVPFGVRFRLNDKVGMFGEGRYYYNTFTFNRNISGETDSITMTGLQFLTGLSLVF
jgi:opacity protein-like surface antigen